MIQGSQSSGYKELYPQPLKVGKFLTISSYKHETIATEIATDAKLVEEYLNHTGKYKL